MCKYGTTGCTCCHGVDNGACDDFVKGGNGNCVYCDHSYACHRLPFKKGDSYNTPLGYGHHKKDVDIPVRPTMAVLAPMTLRIFLTYLAYGLYPRSPQFPSLYKEHCGYIWLDASVAVRMKSIIDGTGLNENGFASP